MHIKSVLDLSYCLWFYSAGWPSSALLLLFSMYMIVQTNMELNRHISQWWLALTNFQTLEGHNNFQVLFGLSCYSETSRKQPKMGRFSFRLRQVDVSLRSKRFRAVSGQRTRARAKDRTKNGAKATSDQNRKSQSSSFLGLSLLRTHTETPATQPIRGRLREVVANLPTGVPS